MKPTNPFADEDQSRKMQRVFMIFARAQEDWVRLPDSAAPAENENMGTELLPPITPYFHPHPRWAAPSVYEETRHDLGED